ncbi:ANTAR domain-containing protein [Streptomyces ziwulingensis]|uniref:ANTAR domain-containing protein n=1 Tax=Streptomyces ziwulingensis TaxID=1045501 RepID=A0ABP9CB62_9ACTN
MTSAAPSRPADRPDGLVIECRTNGDRALLRPRGELVQGCVDTLAETLAGLPAGTGRIELDMSRVVFMETAGLHFLDLLDGHGRRQSVPVTTANWTGQPRRFLELAGLDTDDPLRGPRPHVLEELEEEVEQLRHAIASRPVIDQARGVLMAVHACSSDEAWHILRETSQLSNTKLRSVAEAVTAGAAPDGPPPPPDVRAALRTALARHGH